MPGYVGFANLPNQIHRKSVKRGFEFTLMVVGESGLGKSTLINTLFLTDLYPDRVVSSAQENIEKTVKIDVSTVEIEERGVKVRLTVVDTPGYGDAIDNTDCFQSIIQYINDQFERYLQDESGLNRRHIVDNRVHCCFYFINPAGHGLKPLDIQFMKQLHNKVNIVPVLAKADTLTKQEVAKLKRKVLDEIEENGIHIYPLPDCDTDEEEDYKEQVRQLKEAVPFAVVGSTTVLDVGGKKVKCSVQKYEPVFDVPDLGPPEQPKPPPPKNDITNRFWAYVEQYCQEITVDDIKMLEDLISTPNDDSDYYKTPPLGRHYTLRWAQEDLQDEQKEGLKLAEGKKKGIKGESGNSDLSDKLLKEVDMNGCSDDVAPLGPLTQRLIAGLVEENVLVSDIENKGVDGLGHTRPGLIKSLGLGSASSLEKRIKKELQEQGVMETDYGNEDDDDEILVELRRCQTELRAVSNHNITQLTRLLSLARDSLVRHDLKKRLRDADQKVLEAYRTIAAARQKKKTPSKKDKDIAWKAIKDREGIVRQLDLASNNNC